MIFVFEYVQINTFSTLDLGFHPLRGFSNTLTLLSVLWCFTDTERSEPAPTHTVTHHTIVVRAHRAAIWV